MSDLTYMSGEGGGGALDSGLFISTIFFASACTLPTPRYLNGGEI